MFNCAIRIIINDSNPKTMPTIESLMKKDIPETDVNSFGFIMLSVKAKKISYMEGRMIRRSNVAYFFLENLLSTRIQPKKIRSEI